MIAIRRTLAALVLVAATFVLSACGSCPKKSSSACCSTSGSSSK